MLNVTLSSQIYHTCIMFYTPQLSANYNKKVKFTQWKWLKSIWSKYNRLHGEYLPVSLIFSSRMLWRCDMVFLRIPPCSRVLMLMFFEWLVCLGLCRRLMIYNRGEKALKPSVHVASFLTMVCWERLTCVKSIECESFSSSVCLLFSSTISSSSSLMSSSPLLSVSLCFFSVSSSSSVLLLSKTSLKNLMFSSVSFSLACCCEFKKIT